MSGKKNKKEENSEIVDLDDLQAEDILIDGKFYQGNENILRKEGTFKWTEEMVEDFKLCRKSVLHFAEKHYYIVTLDEGKQKIQLYKYQKKLLKAFKSNRFNVILSSRQSGKTTCIAIYSLWLCCFFDDKNVTIVANKESTAKEIFSRIKMAYEQMPIYLKPAIKSWRKDGFLLQNDSAIKISTTSSAGPRGGTSNLLIIDEMAFCPPEIMKELWKSAIPIVIQSKKSQIVVISTPNGTDNKFYQLYQDSQKPNSIWNLERVDWWDVPGRDEEWKKQAIELLREEGKGEDDFEQEFGNTFLTPGRSIIDLKFLEELKQQASEPILIKDDGCYSIYQLPTPRHHYIVGVDIGEGIGRSNTVAQIYDITDLRNIQQVAVYASNTISPYHFGTRLMNLLIDWGRPPVLIENNNNGGQVIDVLHHTHNYENIVSYLMEGNSKHYKTDGRKGVHNHSNVKFNGISNFRYWSNSLKVVKFNDFETLKELYTFVKQPNATYNKKTNEDLDDRVLASIWALFILTPSIISKHFIVSEFDEQGRPLKVIAHSDNTDLIKQSPLLVGGSVQTLKRNVNVLPSVISPHNNPQVSLLQQEALDLLKWLHSDETVMPLSQPSLEGENNYEYKPIILF